MFRFWCQKFPNRFWFLEMIYFQIADFGSRFNWLRISFFENHVSVFGFRNFCVSFLGFSNLKFFESILSFGIARSLISDLDLEHKVFRRSCFVLGVINFPIDSEFWEWLIFKPPVSDFVCWLLVSFLENRVSVFGFRTVCVSFLGFGNFRIDSEFRDRAEFDFRSHF